MTIAVEVLLYMWNSWSNIISLHNKFSLEEILYNRISKWEQILYILISKWKQILYGRISKWEQLLYKYNFQMGRNII
jgi:hypothetical protein